MKPTEPRRPSPDPAGKADARWTLAERILLGLVLAVAALHFPLIFRLNIGWDEFRFLSDVYGFQRGEITSPLQTIHVHLFGWLPRVGSHEVDRIVVGRFVYYLLLLGTCAFIYLVSRRYLRRAPSLFAVLVYLTYAEVIGHATSFRFDGLSVFLLLASLTLVVRKPAALPAVACAASLAAGALLVTIKSAFYLPTLVLLIAIDQSTVSWQERTTRLSLFAAVGVAAFITLLAIHNTLLPAATASDALSTVQRASATGITIRDPFPRSGYLSLTILANLWTWVLLGLGVVIPLLRRAQRGPGYYPLTMLALILPLGSLAVYRNTFPYFFIFLMPVAAVLCAVPFDDVLRAGRRRSGWALTGMVLVTLVGFGVHYRYHWADETRAQRQVVEAIHRMFPEPVPYIDPNSMIASFPKVGPFMSDWGLEHYRAAGVPMFERWLAEHAPVFLLAHHPALRLDDPEYMNDDGANLFLEDRRVLRENYVHYWGSVYVAGRRLAVPADEAAVTHITVPGPYTVLADAPVLVDAVEYRPGDAVRLPVGPVRLQSTDEPEVVTLRWGQDLYRPPELPPGSVVFRGFYPCGSPFAACVSESP